jgi:hypothetical protein
MYLVTRILQHCSRSVTDPLDGGPLTKGKTQSPKDQSHFSKMMELEAFARPNFVIVFYFTAHLLRSIYIFPGCMVYIVHAAGTCTIVLTQGCIVLLLGHTQCQDDT